MSLDLGSVLQQKQQEEIAVKALMQQAYIAIYSQLVVDETCGNHEKLNDEDIKEIGQEAMRLAKMSLLPLGIKVQ